jgi:[ribosomal protein S5]-alanine N-acetyltransferase
MFIDKIETDRLILRAHREKFWSNGYATEAGLAFLEKWFKDKTLCKVFARHQPKNYASQKVLYKLGFVQTGYKLDTTVNIKYPVLELTEDKFKTNKD